MNSLKNSVNDVSAFFETEAGKNFSRTASQIIRVTIIVFLLYQLSRVGWTDFLHNLPTTPWFYLIILVIYFLLPFSEMVAYRVSWPIGWKEGLPIFIKKRVLNKDVVGYSGELQLFAWVQSSIGISKRETFKVIRDNNILSSLASTCIVFGLLTIFIVSGQISFLELIDSQQYVMYGAILIGLIVLLAVGYQYRSLLFSMPKKRACLVLAIHMGRLVVANVLQVLLWYAVLPTVSLEVWFTYLSISLIMSRVPFVPNRDFLFIAVGIGAADLLSVSSGAVAGLFLTQSIMDKMLNAAFYLFFSSSGK